MSAAIAEAILARVATLNVGSPALTVAYPDVPFDPSAVGGRYLQADLFFNRPAWQGITDGKVAQGLLQVMVVLPRDGGIIAPVALAEAVAAHFPKGLAMISGSTRVRVSEEPWITSPLVENNQTRIPITIPWKG
jgi:hypothetical protein